jgi:hypothetical protein
VSQATDPRLRRFDNHADHLVGAIRLCLDRGYIIPSMMLLFAGIDGMAWLHREHPGEQSGKDFQDWVSLFFIPHIAPGTVTPTDFWAARNALLHEQTSHSRLTRAGTAKSFLFSVGGSLAFSPQSAYRQLLIIDATSVVKTFEAAIARFRSFIETSPRREDILARCAELLDHGGSIVT